MDTLGFTTIQHILTNVDTQPTMDGGAVLHVIGQLKVSAAHEAGGKGIETTCEDFIDPDVVGVEQ